MAKDLVKITMDFSDKLCAAKAQCPVCGQTIKLETRDNNPKTRLPRFLVGNEFLYRQALAKYKDEKIAKEQVEKRLAELNENPQANIELRLFQQYYECPKCGEKELQIPQELVLMLAYDGLFRSWYPSQGDYEIVLSPKHIKMAIEAKEQGLANVVYASREEAASTNR